MARRQSLSGPWRLRELISASGIPWAGPIPDLVIRGVTDDSRHCKEEFLFVAVKGARADGHRHLAEAIRRGAGAVMVEEEVSVPDSVVKIRVPSTRPLLGPLAHAFEGSPSKRMKVIGVTGTNGKTTVCWIIQHLLEAARVPCGLIGTVCNRIGRIERPSGNTTPGAVPLGKMLSEMVSQRMKCCAMEVSSHALDQHRADGIEWACGVFTNLSSEHLDYHGTVQRYLKAKLRLFQTLEKKAAAVINRDDPVSDRVRRATAAKVWTYGLQGPADFSAGEIVCSLENTSFELRTPEGAACVSWRMIGLHNVQNLLAAVGAVMAVGVPLKKILLKIRDFPGVPGRLERVDDGGPCPVFVDYAHTDGALKQVLTQLRKVSSHRILVLFGCGGDRDRAKRPRMGRVAARWADRVIVSSDNPRSEDPAVIAREIVGGMKGSSTPCETILDRREAIFRALESVDRNGLVLIAGKGHEAAQVFRDKVVPFDDRAVVREWLSERAECHPAILK